MSIQANRVGVVAVLPVLHLSACLVAGIAKTNSGWMYISIVDFPASILAMALSYRWDYPLVLFGTIGTLWWLMLNIGAMHLF